MVSVFDSGTSGLVVVCGWFVVCWFSGWWAFVVGLVDLWFIRVWLLCFLFTVTSSAGLNCVVVLSLGLFGY